MIKTARSARGEFSYSEIEHSDLLTCRQPFNFHDSLVGVHKHCLMANDRGKGDQPSLHPLNQVRVFHVLHLLIDSRKRYLMVATAHGRDEKALQPTERAIPFETELC